MSFYGYVYRITNLANAKTYIGKHSPSPNEAWTAYMGSGIYIRKAVAKYGKESFSKELLSEHFTADDLSNAENEAIVKEMLIGKAEYNLYAKSIVGLSIEEESLAAKLYVEDLWTVDDLCLKFTVSKGRMLSILESKRVLRTRYESQRLRFEKPVFVEKECAHCGILFESPRRSRGRTCSRSCQSKLGRSNSKETPEERDERYKKLSHLLKGNSNAKGNATGGKIATHNRWHVKRDSPSVDCSLCFPPL